MHAELSEAHKELKSHQTLATTNVGIEGLPFLHDSSSHSVVELALFACNEGELQCLHFGHWWGIWHCGPEVIHRARENVCVDDGLEQVEISGNMLDILYSHELQEVCEISETIYDGRTGQEPLATRVNAIDEF